MTSQDDLALLKRMYQRGEITDDQYDVLRRHVLWGTPLPQLVDEVPAPRPPADPAARTPAPPPPGAGPARPGPAAGGPRLGGRGVAAGRGDYVPGAGTIGPGRYPQPGESRYTSNPPEPAPPDPGRRPAGDPGGARHSVGAADPPAARAPAGRRYASRRERREAEEPGTAAYSPSSYLPPADGYSPPTAAHRSRHRRDDPDDPPDPAAGHVPDRTAGYGPGPAGHVPDGIAGSAARGSAAGHAAERAAGYVPSVVQPPVGDRAEDGPVAYTPPTTAYPRRSVPPTAPDPYEPASRRPDRTEPAPAEPARRHAHRAGRPAAPDPEPAPAADGDPEAPPRRRFSRRGNRPEPDDERARRRVDGDRHEPTGRRSAVVHSDPDPEDPGVRRIRPAETGSDLDELEERRGRRDREAGDKGRRRPHRRSVLAVLTSVVLALLLAAGGVYWFVLRTDGVPPARYARETCGSVRDWQQAVDSNNATLVRAISRQANRSTVRADVVAYYATVAARTDDLRTAILARGPADVTGGRAYADSLAVAVGDQATALRGLADRARGLDPAAATFQTDLQSVLGGADTAVGAVSAALARPPAGITTELRTALSNEPTCAPYVG